MSRFTITGRLVQGNPHEMRQQLDSRTRQPKMRNDPTTGQMVPFLQCYCAIAVPKIESQRIVIPGNPTFEQVRAMLDADARSAWPQYFGQRPQGPVFGLHLAPDCTNPKFANKIIDGDDFDEQGVPYANNEGWAGCWVVKCANGFAPKVYEWTTTGWQETIHTGRKIKTGDYVTLSGECTTNKSNDSPGMYMNFDTCSFEQEGTFIQSSGSVDPNKALGQRGAVTQPPVQGGTPAQPANASVAQAGPAAHGGQVSQTATAPYDGYRTNGATAGAVPPPPAAPPPPPAPTGPVMTAAATATYEAYQKAGWSDDQLRAAGYML